MTDEIHNIVIMTGAAIRPKAGWPLFVGPDWGKGPVECSMGAVIRRNGSMGNPAFLIHADNGSEVLKLASELDKG